MKTIEVIVACDGSSRVQTLGFSGNACREASRFLEETLGLKQQEQLTADFYRTSVSNVQHSQQRPDGQ